MRAALLALLLFAGLGRADSLPFPQFEEGPPAPRFNGGCVANCPCGSCGEECQCRTSGKPCGPSCQCVAAGKEDREGEENTGLIHFAVFRHSGDQIAVDDSALAVQAAQRAQQEGLPIRTGEEEVAGGSSPLGSFKNWLDVALKANRSDTFILHTIGHGMPDGTLVGLGQRKDVLGIISAAAIKHKQRVVWWQLSCFARAALPDLSGEESRWLVVVNSSPSTHPSGIRNQARILNQMFESLKGGELDKDGDGKVTVAELKEFLNSVDSLNRGELVVGDETRPVFVKPRRGWLQRLRERRERRRAPTPPPAPPVQPACPT